MAQYYKLLQRDIQFEDGEVAQEYRMPSRDSDVIDMPWLRGIALPRPPAEPIPLAFDEDAPEYGVFRDYVYQTPPLMSHRLRDVLVAAGVRNVDFYEVKVEGADDYEDFPGYVAFNVRGVVKVADAARSKAQRAFGTDGANLYDELAVREKLETDLPICRMAEALSTLIVSEAVMQACEDGEIQTIMFEPLGAAPQMPDE